MGIFLPIFFGLLHEMRSRVEEERTGGALSIATPNFQAVPQGVVAEILRSAYVDPSDPTTLYVQAVQGRPVA